MAKDNKERIHYIRKMSNTVEPSDDEERSYFISRFYIHKEFQNVLKKEPKRSRKGAEKGDGEKTAHIGTSVRKSCDDQTQLMEKLELTRKQIQTDIKDLKNESILERKGFNRNDYWIVNKVD